MSRHKMTMKGSKKSFTKNAVKQKKMNSAPPVMRGGIRL